MLAEVIDMLSSQECRVLDPFGGTLYSSIACMGVNLKCLCVEKNSDCFEAAVTRLISYFPVSTEQYKDMPRIKYVDEDTQKAIISPN